MTRTLPSLIIVILLLHSGYQYLRLRDVSAEVDRRARQLLQHRLGQDEFVRAGRWLHEFYRAERGLQRPHGLCADTGEPDFDGMAVWLFDVYAGARMAGVPEDRAREMVLQRIRESDEWRRKHRAMPPS